MEYETLDCMATNAGRLHYYLIAQELRISSAYAYLICKGLERNGYIEFDILRGICNLTEKGKDAIEKSWFLKLKRTRERIQEEIRENKKRISQNVETINY